MTRPFLCNLKDFSKDFEEILQRKLHNEVISLQLEGLCQLMRSEFTENIL